MMKQPEMSAFFAGRQPSMIRMAQIRFRDRTDDTEAINVAIGNVSLPMHPAMIERMHHLDADGSPFRDGVVMYSPTSGTDECVDAFLNVIASSGLGTSTLHGHITDGGTQAMELMIAGVCGPAGTEERPLMLIDPAYTSYKTLCERLGRATCSVTRSLGNDGKYSLPAMSEIEAVVERYRPGAIVVIPFDNPTGQAYDRDTMRQLGKIAVKHNLWMVSDEAYRELYYTGGPVTSIWGLTDADVPGIEGRRIGIETSSKVWNACGLRIGALITDNEGFSRKAIAEHTVSLCSSAIGQYIFGAMAHEDHGTLLRWYDKQRAHYREMLFAFASRMKQELPDATVSSPDASIYSVIDVRKIVGEDFSAIDFIMWCASEGAVQIDGRSLTVLAAPMTGFYNIREGEPNPGRTQFRIAYVVSPDEMELVPRIFARLLRGYLDR